MPEPVTYYHRDGRDYAVFAYDLLELYELTVREGDLTPQAVWDAIRHLETRQRGRNEAIELLKQTSERGGAQ